MRIIGFFDERFEPTAPFIRAILKSKSLELSYPIKLHIDTGASVTILFDRDVELRMRQALVRKRHFKNSNTLW